MNNHVLERLEKELHSESTPGWGRVLLILFRDDHRLLHRHLGWHDQISKRITLICLPIFVAIAIPVVFALLKWVPTILP